MAKKSKLKPVTHHAPHMRGADSGFLEAYIEYGEKKTQAVASKRLTRHDSAESTKQRPVVSRAERTRNLEVLSVVMGMRDVLQKIIVVLGPTASGKSDLAVEIALRFNGEVVSADSRQVYRGLNIGSGKITKREMRGVSHHLLDVANPTRQFSVVQYRILALRTITDITKRGKIPILCGGTGFYIQSIITGMVIPEVPPNKELRKKLEKKNADELFIMLKKLDPRRASEIDAKNPVRLVRAIEIAKTLGSVPNLEARPPSWDILQIGIKIEQSTLREKIIVRLKKRLRKGMLSESSHLHTKGLSWKRMRALGLEYRAMTDLLTGVTTRTEMVEKLTTEICQYAKRQITWFKRDKTIKWFELTEKSKILKAVEEFLKIRIIS